MAVLASDNFNRANSGDLGASWDVMTGENNFTIASNQCALEVGSETADATESNNSVTWPDNQYSQVTLITVAYSGGANDGVGIGPAVRCATAARTYYRCVCAGTTANGTEIAKFVAGTHTALAHGAASWANGDVCYFEANGTSLAVKRNGGNVVSTTDSSISTGRAGVTYSSSMSAAVIDDWEGGSIAAPSKVRRYTAHRFFRRVR